VRAQIYLTKGDPAQNVLRPGKDSEMYGADIAPNTILGCLSPALAALSRQTEPENRTPVSASLG